MTAGRGIVHSERSPADARAHGARVHGIQAWVALPLAAEPCEPGFEPYPAHALPSRDAARVRRRVLAGSAYGLTSPPSCPSPTFYPDPKQRAAATPPLPRGATEPAPSP